MRVWLDDIRIMPSGFDLWAKNADEAITLVNTGHVTFISLDHDLGDYCEACVHRDDEGIFCGRICFNCSCTCHKTGYDVACLIEELVESNKIEMPQWRCHSANPEGRQRIEAAMQNAERIAYDKTKGR